MQSLKELFGEFDKIFSNTNNLDNIDFQEEEIIVNDSLEFIDLCS